MPEINTISQDQWGVKYTRILQRQLQEDKCKLEPFFKILPNCVGRAVNIPFTGKADMKRITSAYQDITDREEAKFGNLVMRPIPFYDVHKYSNDEKLYNNNMDFTMANIITEVRAAANRQRDAVMMGVYYNTDDSCWRKLTVGSAPVGPYDEMQSSGILGTAYMGIDGTKMDDIGDTDNGDDYTTTVVSHDFKYSGTKESTGILLDKIVRAIELLKKRSALVRGVTTGVIALTARQIAEIQMWEQSHNKNYGFGDLVNGFANRVLGVHILETEMLPMVDIEGGKKARICPVWVKEHALYGVWDDVRVRVTPQLEQSINYGQVVTTLSMGSTRKFKESVIQIQCTEELAK